MHVPVRARSLRVVRFLLRSCRSSAFGVASPGDLNCDRGGAGETETWVHSCHAAHGTAAAARGAASRHASWRTASHTMLWPWPVRWVAHESAQPCRPTQTLGHSKHLHPAGSGVPHSVRRDASCA